MLRTVPLSLLGLLATSNLHAQHVRLGVKAGLNASTYSGEDVPNPRFRLGPAIGALLRLPLGKHLDVQPELLYEQRGAHTSSRYNYTAPSTTFRYTHQEQSRLRYLSLPVLLRLHKDKWSAVAGPQVSYLLTAQRRTTETSRTTSGIPDPNLPDYSKTFTTHDRYTFREVELSYVVGVGYQLTPRFSVELRYTAGLTQVGRQLFYETVYVMPVENQQVYNGTLQAQVSYQLGAL